MIHDIIAKISIHSLIQPASAVQVAWLPSPCRVESELVDAAPAFLIRISMNVEVVVQFYPWFKFYFPLFQTHYHTLPTAKQRKIKFNQRNLY